jgi:predicted secreted protein
MKTKIARSTIAGKLAGGAAAGVLALALLSTAAPARADEETTLHRVEFSVQVGREAHNDVVRAVMVASRENVDAARLAEDINRIMASALRDAKAQQAVQVRSGNYQTSPVYEDRRVTRWRAEQELILESRDPDAIHRLLGALQDRLLLRSLGYTVSPEKNRQLETGLVEDALAAFKERADLIVSGLGASGYDIVHLRLDGNGSPPAPLYVARAAMAMKEDSVVAGEPGTSQLTSGVYATIRLRY